MADHEVPLRAKVLTVSDGVVHGTREDRSGEALAAQLAGAGYEAIRFMARHRRNAVVRILLLPVLGTQKFTTREPSDDMLEVAITAFNSAREGEEETAGAAA